MSPSTKPNQAADRPPITALVTGASRGIGRAIALRLASMGYTLAVVGRDGDALDDVVAHCQAHGVRAWPIVADLADATSAGKIVDQANARLGRIDVLINNAGMASRGAVQDADMEAWRAVLELNFTAALDLSHAVLPAMIEQKAGAIINISSISGRHTGAGGAIYAASKHAINGFSGCMFEDVREFGIKVSAVMPGFVDTDLTADLGKQGAYMIQADDVADAIEYILKSSNNCCPTEIVIRPQRQP